MQITNKLKERFTRDCKVSIKLYDEPYFTERLNLYDKYFDTLSKWKLFLDTIKAYNTEEDYLADYNATKDKAINYIKGTSAFQAFNTADMNKFAVSEANRSIPHKDIYHASNIGRKFISIDMKKANFNCMRQYDPEIFGNAKTWEDFIKMFTNNEYIAQSKYIREVIMGNCNCGRHITYEKHIMDGILTGIIDSGVDRKNVVFFSNDEIVLDITDANYDEQVATALIESPVPLRADYFTLRAIKDVNNNGKILGYIREMLNGTYDFKCFNHYNLPFVLRFLNGETPTDNDTVFEYEGNLSKLIKIPTLELI